MEVGPFRLQDDHTLVHNNGSWNRNANLLFVDQPVGTGYSYADTNAYLHELPELADQFIQFLERFFNLFPQFSTDDIYLTGESYAGQTLPYIAQAIHDRNAKQAGDSTRWNVAGMLIGNGWISPIDQYLAYLPTARSTGLISKASESQIKSLEADQAKCAQALSKPGAHIDEPSCEQVLKSILDLTQEPDPKDSSKTTCINMYDMRLRESYPGCGTEWPHDLDKVKPYLRRPDVVKALNVDVAKRTGWSECSGAVSQNFKAKNSAASYDLLPSLLDKFPIMLFSGADDLICGHVGTEDLINKLHFNGGTGFETSPGMIAPRREWLFDGERAGTYQSRANLTYLLIYNSSHMVPHNHPQRSRDMLERFMAIDLTVLIADKGRSTIDGIDATPGFGAAAGANGTLSAAERAAAAEVVRQAKWDAYRRSGEVALVLVIIAALAWFYWIYRDRRASGKGYFGLPTNGFARKGDAVQLESFRPRRAQRDEEELHDLVDEEEEEEEDEGGKEYRDGAGRKRGVGAGEEWREERYSLGSEGSGEDLGMTGNGKPDKAKGRGS